MAGTRRENAEFARRCATVIGTLPIHHPFDLGTFLRDLGNQRGTGITLGRMPTVRGGPSGLLLRARDECWLFVAARAVPSHAAHIVFHELGHWLLGHGSDYVCLGHTPAREEAEAEQFAHLLRARVRAGATRRRERLPPGQAALRAAFGSRRDLCADG